MKNLWAIVFVVLILIVLGLFLFSFQVRETEKALVTLFGDPVRTVTTPGWYFKWPRPINDVHRFDSRSHLYQTVLEETPTRSKSPINVMSYVVWKVGDPETFRTKVRDVKSAENNLDDLLRDTRNTIIGKYYFSDFINSDKSKIELDQIEQEIADVIIPDAASKYGIDVQLVGISRLGVSDETSKSVFQRMSKAMERKTVQITADGDAQAAKIKKDAESKRTELLAIVDAQAKAIQGGGDAEAAKYYKLLEQEEDFAMFLRDIESLKKILAEKTTIVLGADTQPLQLLKKVPDIKPQNPTD